MKLFSNSSHSVIVDKLLEVGEFSISGNLEMKFYVFSKKDVEIKVFKNTVELVSSFGRAHPFDLDVSIFVIRKIRNRIEKELKKKKLAREKEMYDFAINQLQDGE